MRQQIGVWVAGLEQPRGATCWGNGGQGKKNKDTVAWPGGQRQHGCSPRKFRSLCIYHTQSKRLQCPPLPAPTCSHPAPILPDQPRPAALLGRALTSASSALPPLPCLPRPCLDFFPPAPPALVLLLFATSSLPDPSPCLACTFRTVGTSDLALPLSSFLSSAVTLLVFLLSSISRTTPTHLF